MKKAILNVLGILGAVAATASPSEALSASFPAIGGKAFVATEGSCFTSPGNSNAVRNTACSGSRTWIIPLTLSATGNHEFRAGSTFTAGIISTTPQCRFVLRSSTDTNVALGTLTTVNTADKSLGTSNVSGTNVTGHIDCLLTQGATGAFGLTKVKWGPTPLT